MAPQISIIGAGVAGLVLGQCLRKRQIHAIIWEKSKQLPPLQNFGITLQPHAYQPLLNQLGVDESTFYNDLAISHKGKHTSGDAIRVNRSAWLRSLSKDLDIRWDHKLTDISKTSAGQKLTFANHDEQTSTHDADLVIVTDGVHSASRNSQHLSADSFKLEVLPYVVFNGKRRFKADDLPSGLAACLDAANGLSHRSGEVLLQITSGYNDAAKNEVAINYTLSRPAMNSDDGLLGRSNADAESLAKQFIDEASKLKDLPEPFKTVFNADVMKDDRLLHWLMRSALLGSQEAVKLAKDGVALIGDAAHPQPILGGAGANYAVLDALTLAESITESGLDVERYNAVTQPWSSWKVEAEDDLRAMHKSDVRASI